MDGIFWLAGALVIAVIAVLLLLFGHKVRKPNPPSIDHSTSTKSTVPLKNDLLVISVIAKPNKLFESYDLLQAISATGMRYGEMNIFHYYAPGNEKVILFSLASATEPGEFDLDHIGEFSCRGLILFTKLSAISNPPYVFKMMLHVAEQLADDLDGELRADPRTPWDEKVLRQYEEKVNQAKIVEYV